VVVTEGQIYLAALPRAVQDFLRYIHTTCMHACIHTYMHTRAPVQCNATQRYAMQGPAPLSNPFNQSTDRSDPLDRYTHGAAQPPPPNHSTVPVRANLEQCLKPLAFHGVPVTLFDEGYGEALMQILALSTPSLTGPEGFLPPNVRLVSNFFRSGPDGVVSGFSAPPVHEANRNMTTARAFRSGMMLGMGMGMHGGGGGGMRPPPNALVLGGSLDDVALAQGGGVERQVLAVGFVDTDADFVRNLPQALESYDAVILGDGGLQYAAHVIEQIVGSA
jgi:hypothetical protein